jgi:hypothetical protein
MSEPPIDPKQYLRGASVVDIGDLRIARGMSRRTKTACRHRNMVYDLEERRVWCEDCESTVDAFDAFVGLVEYWDSANKKLDEDRRLVASANSFVLRSRAAKAFDEVWRRSSMVPLCPHCHKGILPEDVARGVGSMSKKWCLKSRGLQDA